MNSAPQVISSVSEFRNWRREFRKQNPEKKIGFVPTMGALHQGHAELLRESKKKTDFSVLSIFVNPTQFGENEDFSKYPRNLEKDLKIAQTEGVDLIFVPPTEEMFTQDFSTFVEETQVSLPLCGQVRPGHFEGVTTVVTKLFHLVLPDVAFFGLKDAQQYFVIRKMVKDLNFDIEIKGVETVREADGLALSSRNTYLSKEDRKKAPLLYQCLKEIQKNLLQGASVLEELARGTEQLTSQGFKVEYLKCMNIPELTPFQFSSSQGKPYEVVKKKETLDAEGSYLIAIAAYLGTTRLIDNLILGPTRD